MKVSIILPVYNGAIFLKQSIESILNQDFKDFEFIIIDDCSKDNSWKIIKSYKSIDNRIVAIKNEKNQGLPKTLNIGLNLAKSNLVIRMDQDDESLPNRISAQYQFMKNNPKISVAGSFVYHMGSNKNNDHLIFLPNNPQEIKNKLLKGENCLYHPSVIMRKKNILSVGAYRTEFKNCEDFDLWLRVIKKFKISNIDIPLLRYRISLGGMTFTKKWEQLYYVFLALEASEHPKESFLKLRYLAQKRLELYSKEEFLYFYYKGSLEELLDLKIYKDIFKLFLKIFKDFNVFKSFSIIIKALEHSFFSNFGKKISKVELNKKNILFALPFLVLGGAEKRFKIIAQLLKKHNYKISIISTVYFNKNLFDVSSEYEKITNNIFHLPKLLNNYYDWKKFIFYFIESRKIGIILLGGSQYFYEILSEIKQKFPNIKIIDQQFNTSGHFISNRKYSKYIDHTICENEEISNKLIYEYKEDPKKVTLIHNGVDIKEFSKKNDKIKPLSNKQIKNKITISFIGRLSEEKGPDLFIEIAKYFQKNKKIIFILAGPGPEKEKCQKLIKSYKLKNIITPGIVDSKQYLKSTNILLVPSKIDGRPNIILESMSMGVPVIAFNVGGIPQMINHNINGYVCQNIQEMKNHINYLISHPRKLSQMGKNARSYAVKNFNENLNINKYLKIIK